jgi:hypothetical protein
VDCRPALGVEGAHEEVWYMRAMSLPVALGLMVACAPALQEFRASYPDGKSKEAYTYYMSSRGDTVRHGGYVRWYPSGVVALSGRYDRGSLDSTWEWWSGQGAHSIATWMDGQLHGPYRNALAGDRGDYPMLAELDSLGALGDTIALRYYAKGEFAYGKREGKWMEARMDTANPDLPMLWTAVGRCSAGVKVGHWLSKGGDALGHVGCMHEWYVGGEVVRTGDCTDSLRRADSASVSRWHRKVFGVSE